MWYDIDPCLNNFNNFYMAVIVIIVSSNGLSTDVCHRHNICSWSKLALYSLLLHFNSCLEQL